MILSARSLATRSALLLAMAGATLNYGQSGDHPRIFLSDPAYRAKLEARVAANDPSWQAFKAKADFYASKSYTPYGTGGTCTTPAAICWTGGIDGAYQGGSWYNAAIYLGIAYQMTGNTTYSNKGRELLAVMSSAWDGRADCSTYTTGIPPTVNGGFGWRNIGPAMGFLYDWIYDQLSTEEKNAVIAAAGCYYDWSWAKNPNSFRTHRSHFNYSGGFLLGVATLGYAIEGDSYRGAQFINYASSQWQNVYGLSFASGAFSGGFPAEAYGSYGTGHTNRLLEYLWMRKTAGKEDLISGSDIPDKLVRAFVHALQPNRWRTSHESGGSMPSGVMWGELPMMIARVAEGTDAAKWARHFLDDLAVSPSGYSGKDVGKWGGHAARWNFMYRDDAQTSENYKLSFPTYYDEGNDHIWLRSDWTDSAIWSQWTYGTGLHTGHSHQSHGQIKVARGSDYLLINGDMWYGLTGDGSKGPYEDPYGRVWRSSSLYFHDRGDYLLPNTYYLGGGQPNAVNSEGYRLGIWAGVSQLKAKKLTATYAYAKTDLTSGWDKSNWSQNTMDRTLRHFFRSFAWLGGGYFVIYDRIEAKAASPMYDKRLFWHLPPNTSPSPWMRPAITGNEVISATVGKSKLVLNTVMPKSATTTFAYDPATITTTNANVFSGSETNRQTMRVEVTDTTSDTFNPLTVILAIGADEAVPSHGAIAVIDEDHVGAFIADATTPRIAIFSTDGAIRSTLHFSRAFSGAAQLFVADLEPGHYTISRDGAPIGTALVESDGTLWHTVTGGGGSFALIGAPVAVYQPLVIRTAMLHGAVENVVYSHKLTASGGNGVYTWSVSAGALPEGLELSADGMLSGVPLLAANSSFTVACFSGDGQTVTQTYSLVVALKPPDLAVTGAALAGVGIR